MPLRVGLTEASRVGLAVALKVGLTVDRIRRVLTHRDRDRDREGHHHPGDGGCQMLG